MQLAGEFEGSGFKKTPYLVRRPDGQVIQLSKLLYLVAQAADGQKDEEAIAAAVSGDFGKKVSGDNVRYLVEEKLRPLGVLENPDGSTPHLRKPDPLLALKLKKSLVSEKSVGTLTRIFKPLFWPPVMIAVVGGFVAMDVWFFGIHGVAQGIRHTLYQPAVVLLLYALLIASVMWHEIGHATACAYGGGKPGVIGFGIYIVWPAFYCDVTDAYRLGKGARVRTDVGGVYFNLISSLGIAGAYFLTGFEPLLALLLVQHVLMIYQFMPFLRMDGYYVVSDLTGIPDLFSRIRPTLVSWLPWKKPSDKVTEMKPWVRWVVSAWVFLTVPFLIYAFGMLVLGAPRLLATAHDSFLKHWDTVSAALRQGSAAKAASGSIQMGMLALPIAGMGVTFSRLGLRFGKSSVKLARQRPALVFSIATAAVAAGGWVLFLLPSPEYRPISPEEKGTVADSIEVVSAVTRSRPALRPATEVAPTPEPTTTTLPEEETDESPSPTAPGEFETQPSPSSPSRPSPSAAPDESG